MDIVEHLIEEGCITRRQVDEIRGNLSEEEAYERGLFCKFCPAFEVCPNMAAFFAKGGGVSLSETLRKLLAVSMLASLLDLEMSIFDNKEVKQDGEAVEVPEVFQDFFKKHDQDEANNKKK